MAHKHENPCPIPDEICAAYREQQRIIKLFEEQDYAAWLGMNEAAIALIKGEPNEL